MLMRQSQNNKIETSLIVITSMLAAQILHETLDELRETSFYKHKLKQITVQFQKELTNKCDETIRELYNTDDETVLLLEKSIYEIASKIATMHPAQLVKLAEQIKEL